MGTGFINNNRMVEIKGKHSEQNIDNATITIAAAIIMISIGNKLSQYIIRTYSNKSFIFLSVRCLQTLLEFKRT